MKENKTPKRTDLYFLISLILTTLHILCVGCSDQKEGISANSKDMETLELNNKVNEHAIEESIIGNNSSLLIGQYKLMAQEEQIFVKNKLEDLYHEYISIDSDKAYQYRDLHTSLVNVNSECEEIFSYILGVQQPHATEKVWDIHKGKPSQLASQETIIEMGSDLIKLAPERRHLKSQGFDVKGLNTLRKRIQHPIYQEILDMDYRVCFFWAHGTDVQFDELLSDKQKEKLYEEFYDFTCYLLEKYSNTGKVFMIGNWEGDWLLTSQGGNLYQDAEDFRIQNMIEWFNIRHKAIEKAKEDQAHENVRVHLYCELNHVALVKNKGYKRIVDSVLPYTYVDYVSISSYDMQGIGLVKDHLSIEDMISLTHPMFDFVVEHLPPRDIPGKRVFTGEVGYTIHHMEAIFGLTGMDAEREQARISLMNAVANLEWGVDFWQIWALHNNEIDKDGNFKGWGIYDQVTGRKRLLYGELVTFFNWASDYTKSYQGLHNKLPENEKFRKAAIAQIKKQLEVL